MSDDKPTRTLPERDPDFIEAMARRTQKPRGTGLLTEKKEIMLLFENEDVKRFEITANQRWILGRFENTDHPDQLDLSPYDATEKGVSRFHLQLHVENDQLFATDLGSTNGTYVTGNPLQPNKANVIRNGDTLLLGRLQIQVLFR